jgi:hypothetical protein
MFLNKESFIWAIILHMTFCFIVSTWSISDKLC